MLPISIKAVRRSTAAGRFWLAPRRNAAWLNSVWQIVDNFALEDSYGAGIQHLAPASGVKKGVWGEAAPSEGGTATNGGSKATAWLADQLVFANGCVVWRQYTLTARRAVAPCPGAVVV